MNDENLISTPGYFGGVDDLLYMLPDIQDPELITSVTVKAKPEGRFLVQASYLRAGRRRRTSRFILHRPDGIQLMYGKGEIRVYPRDAPTGLGVLRLAVLALPIQERAEWLEEQRAYLTDLSTRRHRWAWILETLLAMPSYAYTVRTGAKKETA